MIVNFSENSIKALIAAENNVSPDDVKVKLSYTGTYYDVYDVSWRDKKIQLRLKGLDVPALV